MAPESNQASITSGMRRICPPQSSAGTLQRDVIQVGPVQVQIVDPFPVSGNRLSLELAHAAYA